MAPPKKNSLCLDFRGEQLIPDGATSEVQFALVVEHRGAFINEVDIRGETAGGLYPPHWLRAKSDAKERRMVLDPSK